MGRSRKSRKTQYLFVFIQIITNNVPIIEKPINESIIVSINSKKMKANNNLNKNIFTTEHLSIILDSIFNEILINFLKEINSNGN